jgi:hypothetical protein
MCTVRRSVRARGSGVSSPAACLAGLSYGALGYLHDPDSPAFVVGTVVLLTDPEFPGVLVSARPADVGFAALFCMSAIAWGWALFRGSP